MRCFLAELSHLRRKCSTGVVGGGGALALALVLLSAYFLLVVASAAVAVVVVCELSSRSCVHAHHDHDNVLLSSFSSPYIFLGECGTPTLGRIEIELISAVEKLGCFTFLFFLAVYGFSARL